jgi:hypothetical protein
LTGAGRFLRALFRRAQKECDGPWFVVGMHGGSTIGEQYFCCELDKLEAVLRGIGSDSPEFRAMLCRAGGLVPLDNEDARERRQDAEPFLDRSNSTVI